MDIDTVDLTSYYSGYDEYCERNEEEYEYDDLEEIEREYDKWREEREDEFIQRFKDEKEI